MLVRAGRACSWDRRFAPGYLGCIARRWGVREFSCFLGVDLVSMGKVAELE